MSKTGTINAVRSLAHTVAALTTNCATFRRAWTNPQPDAGPAGSLTGRWEGEWVSEENGHRGALLCVLLPLDEKRYRACFHARYSKVLRVCYSVELHSTRSGSTVHLKGETNLGALAGGIYQYKGEADRRTLRCTYRCRYDHGTFHLRKG